MADFSLKSGSDTLGFDIAGNVTKNGAAFGTWTVGRGIYREIAKNFETEKTQILLAIEYFADNPCPIPEFSALVKKHTPDKLKTTLEKYFKTPSLQKAGSRSVAGVEEAPTQDPTAGPGGGEPGSVNY